MNRRTFLTGLASTTAAVAFTGPVAAIVPTPQLFVFQNRMFWISGPQTISWVYPRFVAPPEWAKEVYDVLCAKMDELE